MYKNQLQELAQRSCFNLPAYTCIREGPDHAPRFKATVNFNGETFESTGFFTTLRQAEHSAAEVALTALSTRGPSHSLTARILDETGVYKNLLQEIAQRVGAPLPSYTTSRSGLGHPPIFTGAVEIAGIIFTGEPAKNKKQAEKNSAMSAWSSLKQLALQQEASSSGRSESGNEEQEQVTLARALLNYRRKEMAAAMAGNPETAPFPRLFPFRTPYKRPLLRTAPPSGSKILPFLQQRSRMPILQAEIAAAAKFPTAAAAPYVPVRHCRPFVGVTVRTAVPVFSAPPLPLNSAAPSYHPPPVKCASRPVAPFVPVQVKPRPVAPFVPVVVPPLKAEVAPAAAEVSLAAAEVAPILPPQKASDEQLPVANKETCKNISAVSAVPAKDMTDIPADSMVTVEETTSCVAANPGAIEEESGGSPAVGAVTVAGMEAAAESLKELVL